MPQCFLLFEIQTTIAGVTLDEGDGSLGTLMIEDRILPSFHAPDLILKDKTMVLDLSFPMEMDDKMNVLSAT